MEKIYTPIEPFQIRIIRLHGSYGAPDAPLVCDFYVADILHATFEGFAIHPSTGAQRAEYNALSYTWGSDATPAVISCNGADLPIGLNLYDALRALRLLEKRNQFIWVDSICINQSDKNEVSNQVSAMFIIYQKAAQVIAWIGSAPEHENDVGEVIKANFYYNIRKHNQEFLKTHNVWSMCRSLSYIYSRPWFRRIWIQQEVFAARTLRLQCGRYRFPWGGWFSDPWALHIAVTNRLVADEAVLGLDFSAAHAYDYNQGPEQITVALSQLRKQHRDHLGCFE
jgi:hypothetical protein